ncbi:GFA family protein [Indioceanicola profundi]|uniref:GFA family protein n=1 Tax=Indioceanicola profundi TaxID=2220096 RepID=UPI000E6ADFA9|nr:GFA family protein [Indioceanicola profundi]
MTDDLHGGCLCGAVRYRISGAIAATGVAYCHCGMCRKASGAPVMAWATFPAGAVWLTGGAPASYASSPKALRQFCPNCGTQLFFTYTEGEPEFDVAICTLDDPSLLPPRYHIWTASILPWFETADSLPRHTDDGPDWSPYRAGR